MYWYVTFHTFIHLMVSWHFLSDNIPDFSVQINNDAMKNPESWCDYITSGVSKNPESMWLDAKYCSHVHSPSWSIIWTATSWGTPNYSFLHLSPCLWRFLVFTVVINFLEHPINIIWPPWDRMDKYFFIVTFFRWHIIVGDNSKPLLPLVFSKVSVLYNGSFSLLSFLHITRQFTPPQ